MTTSVLATKLYIPAQRANLITRPRLSERMNDGLQHKLTLVSAPAGFGKTTLVSTWVADCQRPIAWLSMDQDDSDPTRFLTYLVSALQTLFPTLGQSVLTTLQSPQPPPPEVPLTALLNEIAAIAEGFVIVLDDYHQVEGKPIDRVLTFLLDHLPPQHHLVITTREDPNLPLARLRASGQLSEVRASDLRFSPAEATDFLNQGMGFKLSPEEIGALENRTEGWIAGLQLAALSMKGQRDSASFIQSFTGSHRFVMDYLVEEVLHQQPAAIQTFLLRTSVLNRFCASLCDSVLAGLETEDAQFFDRTQDKFAIRKSQSTAKSQSLLEYLEQANLFIVPLDNERHWYRYHHLFAELLRQRLKQSLASSAPSERTEMEALHIRASQWFEENGLELEAFQHAAAANDIERAERLIDGKGIPLHLRGAVTTILNWLESLPVAVLNARPWLWWRHASLLLVNGHTTGVAEKLQAAEAALQSSEWDERLGEKTRNFVGRIATARSVLALTRYDTETILLQSQRALDYLDAGSLSARANAYWTRAFAHFIRGEREAARTAYLESIALGEACGDVFATILATIGLADVQRMDLQLHAAAESYRKVLRMAGDQPQQIISEAHLGLARVLYEWNDLAGAERVGQQSLQLARQYERVIDRFIASEVFLALLKLAHGDAQDAEAMLAQSAETTRQRNFVLRMPEVATAQVITFLRLGRIQDAAQIAQQHKLPMLQARVHLAQGDPAAALALLEAVYQQAEERAWADEKLRAMVLQAIAWHMLAETERAVALLGKALELAEPAGLIRLFVDEGLPMMQLLQKLLPVAHDLSVSPSYINKLLAIFPSAPIAEPPISPLPEALSEREIEVLQLLAGGLKDQEIGDRLFVSLNTVRYHTKNIYGKLGVNKRTQAMAKAQELKLLPTREA